MTGETGIDGESDYSDVSLCFFILFVIFISVCGLTTSIPSSPSPAAATPQPLCLAASLRGNIAGHGRGTVGTSATDVFGRAQRAVHGFGPLDPSPFVAHMSCDGATGTALGAEWWWSSCGGNHSTATLKLNLVVVIKSTDLNAFLVTVE